MSKINFRLKFLAFKLSQRLFIIKQDNLLWKFPSIELPCDEKNSFTLKQSFDLDKT